MYQYIHQLGPQIETLRIPVINKTKLKSNNYWLMALVSKMPALKVLKFHKIPGGKVLGTDGYKFLLKGLNYLKENGRELKKVEFNNLLGSSSTEHLYPMLKIHDQLISLSFNNLTLSNQDAKAIGKVLADFKMIRELDLTSASLNTTTTKDIADGLMRAKQLEILKVGGNTGMGASVNAIIYNLAFSPKIRMINLENMTSTNTDTAEALYKLLNISGSVETLILSRSDVIPRLTEEFYKAVG